MRWLSWILVGLTATAAGAETAPSTSGSPPASHVERSMIRYSSFWIPLVPNEQLAAPLQVVLLMSTDRGQTWSPYQELILKPDAATADSRQPAPMKTGFTIRNLNDGEYWFMARTAEQLAQGLPSSGKVPDDTVIKVVVIDTVPPKGDLQLETAEGDTLFARLSVADIHLRPDTLRVEYQDERGNWTPLVVTSVEGPTQGGHWVATTSPIPRPVNAPRVVRLEVRDQAGNVTSVTQAAEVEPDPRAADTGEAAAGPLAASPGPESSAPPQLPPIPKLDWETAESSSPAGQADDANTGSIPGDSDDVPPWHRETTAQRSPSESSPAGAQGNDRAASGGPPSTARAPGHDAVGRPAWPSAAEGEGVAGPAWPSSASRLPSPDQTWPVHSFAFQLEYDLEFVGPEGLLRVDLYSTTDGGRTWQRHGEDPDRRSPIAVQVDHEGLYGFRLHPVSRHGFAGAPPQPGDVPDTWILVDQTKPEAEITSVRLDPSTDEQPAALIIGWTASDPWLAPQPVTLQFSAQRDGPWSTIAAGIPNRGQYRWTLDDTLPRQVYLQLSVEDRAGNVALYQLPHPVSTSPSGPAAHIRRVIGG